MNSDFLQIFSKIPPFTKYYLLSVIFTSFIITYSLGNIDSYMTLDFEYTLYKLQLWRIMTNFCIIGKFSFGFLFFIFMMYQQLSSLESKAISMGKYSEFLMMIIYLMAIIVLINIIFQYKIFLSMELLFSLMYILSKRQPNLDVSLWGFGMKSK